MENNADLNSPSYMEMTLNLDGEDALVLRIPTFWDAVEKQWIGAIKTPLTKKLISAIGKNSFQLQNNFNIVLSKMLHESEFSDEIFGMFKLKGK
jgi:hypothetical protein